MSNGRRLVWREVLDAIEEEVAPVVRESTRP
jgi:hypothetical protein